MDIQSQSTELVITRVFDAPRELVWKAWTDREALWQWWGPKDCKIEVHQLDLRPGGKFLYSMVLPNGSAVWGRFVFSEIKPPERLVFTNSFSDETGNIVRAPFSKEFPLEINNILIFEENDGKTTLTLRGRPINATPEEIAFYTGMQGNMRQGFAGTFERLDAYLQSSHTDTPQQL